MRVIRKPAVFAAASMTAILLLYFALIADRALILLRTSDVIAKALGVGLIVLPALGAWWLVNEWRLGVTVQRMEDLLDAEGRLPVDDSETLPSGRLTDDAAAAVFARAQRLVDEAPDDWAAWFGIANAYDANRDRSMARRAMRHAADLYRAERRASVDS